jgi:hypothetical protein
VVAYKQYQQAWFTATQNYSNQKITALASTDAKVQQQWQESGEASARAQVQAAESDWETKGFKMQVEQARGVEQTYASQSPRLKWNSWTAACNPAIDFPTDPTTNSPFGPTVFAPYDILDHGVWPSFSISGSEIPNLVNQASPELKNIFGTTGNSTVDSLSFEYCSVALSRPWLRPDVFSARFWRLPDATVQLSDGNVPPQGDWPAYIVAVVFARNIVVTLRAAGAAPQPQPTFQAVPLESLHVQAQPAPHPLPAVLRAQAVVTPQPATISRNLGSPIFMRAAPIAEARQAIIQPGLVASAAAQPTATINPALRAQLSAATFTTATPAQTPSKTESSGAQVSILAFICKQLPKCPYPDPSLKWS